MYLVIYVKFNLQERSTEISFLVETELRALEIPCSLNDMVKRVGANRISVIKHIKSLIAKPDFADISIVRLGGTYVIYRIVKPNPPRQEKEVENYENHGSDADTVSELGRSGEEGQVGQ